MTGYSGTSLIKKLGMKENFRICFYQAPDSYFKELGEFPKGVAILDQNDSNLDFVHLFTKQMAEVIQLINHFKPLIRKNGMIWVSWPKKSSKVVTDINEDLIRKIALEMGLVDVKVCAVDEIWSGLKLVYRVKDR